MNTWLPKADPRAASWLERCMPRQWTYLDQFLRIIEQRWALMLRIGSGMPRESRAP